MPDEGGTGNLGVKVVFCGVGFIFSQGSHFLVYIIFKDFHQEIWKKTVAAAQHIKTKDRNPAKGAQAFFSGCGVVLVQIVFGVGKDDIGVILLIKGNQVFQDFLARVRETTGFELPDNHVFFWYA